MDVEIAFFPDGLSARLFIINIRFYETELNPVQVAQTIFNNELKDFEWQPQPLILK